MQKRAHRVVWREAEDHAVNGCMARIGHLCDTLAPSDAVGDTDGDVVEFREARLLKG
jgi:hypothetical protein